jgi:hypothetical protein
MRPQPARNEDPLITELRGMMARLGSIIEEIERRDTAQLHEQHDMIEAARRVARSDDMSSREVAEFLGVSERSVHQGFAGTACLFRARITNGRSVRHLRQRVELHRRNQMDRGECGDCDKATLAKLRLVAADERR